MKIINVKGFEGIYAVSDDGRVFSLKRGIEMKQNDGANGYLHVCLYKDGRKITKPVHVIVYNSFHKQDFLTRRTDDLVIDHIDEDKHNNRLDNLRRIRTRENSARCPYYNKNSFPRGVHYLKARDKYAASFMAKGERYYLGTYSTPEEAGKAYEEAVKAYEEHGIVPKKKDRTVKTCKVCGQTKPIADFYYKEGHGYSWMCKECAKEYARQKRAKEKDKQQI